MNDESIQKVTKFASSVRAKLDTLKLTIQTNAKQSQVQQGQAKKLPAKEQSTPKPGDNVILDPAADPAIDLKHFKVDPLP